MTEPQQPRSAAAEHPAPEELSELAFSPEAATAALYEHVQGCAPCTAEVAELRAVMVSLAELPQPAIPESVGIRLDAAIARAWQEADAPREAAAKSAAWPVTRRTGLWRTGLWRTGLWRTGLWRKLALPLAGACLVVLAAVGLGELVRGGSGTSSATSAGAAAPAFGVTGDSALTRWVQSVLPVSRFSGATAGSAPVPQAGSTSAGNHTFAGPLCSAAPAHAGYTSLAVSQREFRGQPATLVVYQNDQEPASRPLFAVVYAGSCPTVSSVVLDQGLVSR